MPPKKGGSPLDELHEEELRPVSLPSGGLFWVYEREVAYFQERVKRYMKDNHFTNIADLATLDQILIYELLVWRWGTWISQQKDWWGETVNTDPNGLPKSLKETSAELRQLKGALGIDKVTRDKQRGEESVAEYLAELRVRAKEFGILRESQLAKALELAQELIALITLHDNCDEIERREQHVKEEDVLNWVRQRFVPEFQAVDAHFRVHKQKMWIREQ